MGKISVKDNGLVALLPEHLRESKLTGAEKLILGDLLFLYGRDFAKENGFVYRTNQDLMKDTGIKSSSTLCLTLRKLEINGFINRTGGKRNKASEYRLNMDKINDSNVTEIHSNNENNNRNDSIFNRNETEMDIISSRLERLENLLSEKFDVISTKFDTMIEILQKIQFDNNRNDSIFNRTTDKETESHKESSNNILHIDISSITSEEIDHLDNFLKKKIIKEKANYMKDNEISGPEVNEVASIVNNGMNDTTNNNSTPDHLPVSDTQHTDTTVSPTPESHSHNECTVPSVDGKNNMDIDHQHTEASDTSDTSTVLLSGDGGIGGMVPSVEENNIQPVQVSTSDALDTPTVYASGNEGIVSTHTTSEGNTIPTVNGTETLQHPAYSSAKPSKIYAKKGAAAVGGGDFGAAQKSCETASNTPTVEQLPTSTEKVDNSQPSYSDTASNGEIDMFYAQYGCTREEYEEIQRSFHKSNWRSLPCKLSDGRKRTMAEAIDCLNKKDEDGKLPKEPNTLYFVLDGICPCMERYLKEGKMSQDDYDDCLRILNKLTRRYYAYWDERFSHRAPNKNNPSEMKMWNELGCPKPSEKTDITSIPTVNTVDTDFEDEMAYLDFESGTMTKKHSTTA